MKQKTNKAVAKRFKVTKNKKVLKRTCGQDHFNSQERGNTTRNKRKDKTASGPLSKTVRKLLPYS